MSYTSCPALAFTFSALIFSLLGQSCHFVQSGIIRNMTNSSLNTHTPFKKALGHVRVLDLTRVLAGPWCAQNLADLGADVIKIERPGAGDDTRSWGPPYLRDAQGRDTTEAAYYLAANRGKRSLTLDIASAEGQAIVRDLAKHCDVVLENYKVGQLKKYGLDYESLRREKT